MGAIAQKDEVSRSGLRESSVQSVLRSRPIFEEVMRLKVIASVGTVKCSRDDLAT